MTRHDKLRQDHRECVATNARLKEDLAAEVQASADLRKALAERDDTIHKLHGENKQLKADLEAVKVCGFVFVFVFVCVCVCVCVCARACACVCNIHVFISRCNMSKCV